MSILKFSTKLLATFKVQLLRLPVPDCCFFIITSNKNKDLAENERSFNGRLIFVTTLDINSHQHWHNPIMERMSDPTSKIDHTPKMKFDIFNTQPKLTKVWNKGEFLFFFCLFFRDKKLLKNFFFSRMKLRKSVIKKNHPFE